MHLNYFVYFVQCITWSVNLIDKQYEILFHWKIFDVELKSKCNNWKSLIHLIKNRWLFYCSMCKSTKWQSKMKCTTMLTILWNERREWKSCEEEIETQLKTQIEKDEKGKKRDRENCKSKKETAKSLKQWQSF